MRDELDTAANKERMMRAIGWPCVLLYAVFGCTEVHEVDLSRTPDFDWDGKVRVTIQSALVPWPDSDVTSIELSSRDGRVARIIPTGSNVHASVDLPVRTVDVSFSQPGD